MKRTERYLNTAVYKTTGMTPYEALHGYQPNHDTGIIRRVGQPMETRKDPKEIQKEVRECILKKQEKMKNYYDKRHFGGVSFDRGEIVVMIIPPSQGEASKLQPKYRGPLIMTEVLPGYTYRVINLGNKGRSFITTAHVSQLKTWCKEKEETDKNDQSENDEDQSEKEESDEEDQNEDIERNLVRTRLSRKRQQLNYLKDYIQ